MKPLLILAAIVSLLAYIVIGFYTNWQTALAIYVLVFITSLDKDYFK